MIETSYLYHNIKQLQFSEETKKKTPVTLRIDDPFHFLTLTDFNF